MNTNIIESIIFSSLLSAIILITLGYIVGIRGINSKFILISGLTMWGIFGLLLSLH